MGRQDDTLRTAYETTDYRVFGPAGPFSIRCGAPCAAADGLLTAARVEAWAFVSACNPRSVRLDDAENRRRHEALVDAVNGRGLTHHPAIGVADDGSWPVEESLFVVGIDEAGAVDLGRAFEQLAVVVGRRGEPARLAWIHRDHGA